MKTKNKNIKQHEDKYIHIPKVNLLPLIGLILFILLAIGNYQLIDKEVISEAFKSCEEECVYNLVTSDLKNLYPIIGEYILISLALISLVALFKGGYSELKSYDEEGLIGGLIFGLIGGLIFGLIIGLIFGLIIGLIYGLFVGLFFGLIIGLIIGLIFGLIGGLIAGFLGEFN